MIASYTRQIADFAASLRLKDVPPEVIARARWLLLDGLGCGLYGADLKWVQILANVVRRLEPQGGQSTIWGRGESASAVNAALVNGTMVQGYELDDSSAGGYAFHGCAAVLPAVLAAAEYVGADKVDGGKLLLAIIAGFEIGPRVSRCVDGTQLVLDGWHAPAVISSFPAAIAAGTILGLNSNQFFHALGIAGTQASGLMAALYGSMVKRMQCAKNSQSGLYAALLAADGFTGIENIFEEKYGGYCSTFTHSSDRFKLPALVDGLGMRWDTMQAGMKIYSCRGGNHTVVIAVEELMRESGLKAQDVAAVTVGVTELAIKHGGWSPYVPKGLMGAQVHIGFCVAMQLVEGNVFVDQMVEENIARPDLIELANRVRVVRSVEREQRDRKYSRGCDVEVTLKSGQVLKRTVDFRPGSEHQPLTAEQMTTKFRRLAAKTLSAQNIAQLETLVWNLERASAIAPLIEVLKGNR